MAKIREKTLNGLNYELLKTSIKIIKKKGGTREKNSGEALIL